MARRFARALVALLLTSGLGMQAVAQETYPARTIKFVAPYTVGGVPDIMTRVLVEHLQRTLKNPVIVENRPGASGAIGVEYAIKSAPDGYTFLLGGGSFTVLQLQNKNFNYDVTKELEPITMIARGTVLLLARKNAPFRDMRDLIQYAKANPGRVSFGTSGPGWNAFQMEHLKQLTNIQFLEVPYKGVTEAHIGVAAGEVDLALEVPSASKPLVDSGKVTAILAFSRQRVPTFPDVPHPAEVGLPDLRGEWWYGFFAPKGTPGPIIEKISASVETLDTPARQRIREISGADFVGGGPLPLKQQLEAEIATFRSLAVRAGIKPQ